VREIKFRAWDRENQEWVHAEPIFGFFPCVGGLADEEYSLMNDEDRFGDIQQYTGLKDKNGKEIYEGDLVLAINAKSPSEVSWNDDGHWQFWQIGSHLLKMEEWEIIGNIYENPELLEK